MLRLLISPEPPAVVAAFGLPPAAYWPDGARMLMAVSAGAVFGWIAYRYRLLSLSGAIAGALFATTLAGAGGWAWIVPAMAFFIPSSLLSRWSRSRRGGEDTSFHDAKGDVRDAWQVLANGGVGWVLMVAHAFVPASVLYWGFVGALAAAAADTWATEVGRLSPRRPRLVTTGRRVARGTSGAVSWWGMGGALAGAAVVALGAWPFRGAMGGRVTATVACVVACGVAASLVDSLAGATVQARFADPTTGSETERHAVDGRRLDHVAGWRWVNNDVVNLACTLSGALATMTCFRAHIFGF